MFVTHLLNQLLQPDFVVAQTFPEVFRGVRDPLPVGGRCDEIPVNTVINGKIIRRETHSYLVIFMIIVLLRKMLHILYCKLQIKILIKKLHETRTFGLRRTDST